MPFAVLKVGGLTRTQRGTWALLFPVTAAVYEKRQALAIDARRCQVWGCEKASPKGSGKFAKLSGAL